MTSTFAFHDERNIARIINLALRMGCSCTRFLARRSGAGYQAQAEFEGSDDALRRLQNQIDKIADDDKETFGERSVR